MKKHIPNLFTLFSLFSGCMALVFVFNEEYELVWIFAFAAGILDVLDGLLARLLNAYTKIGESLDSMADMVSSGVVPGAVMYMMLEEAMLIPYESGNTFGIDTMFAAMPGFLLTMAAGWRLAKFNVDEGQDNYFRGIPTPAAMIFIIGLMMVAQTDAYGLRDFIMQVPVLLTATVIISYMMVANTKIFNIKFKKFQWKGNEVKLTYIIYCFASLFLLGWISFPLGIIVYILLSIVFNFINPRALNFE